MSDIFKKILVATDGSANSLAAAEEAIKIARSMGSSVYAIYVVDTSVLSSASLGEGESFIYNSLKDEGKKAVDQIRSMASGVQVETQVIEGKPTSAITDFASKNGIDLIVVGSQGKSKIEALLLGSVADRVLRTATCPVLVVKN
jgi:nucleotide-binding universal stress UspA family protein